MEFQVVRTEDKVRGKLYYIDVSGKEIDLMMTWHALDRMKVWNLNINQILISLLEPEEVIVGHHGRYIAHRRYGKHVLRAVYEHIGLPTVITVYFPSAERYFRGGGKYADKILT